MLSGMPGETGKLTLPYLPSAFPDELLGSWLSRLVYLNAESSLSNFAQTYSLDATIKSPLADPVNGGGYVRSLSNLLGFDYDDFVRTFTTKAYWDVFQPLALESLPNIAAWHGRVRSSTKILRVCPACIDDDLLTQGYPYFHRTHQLHSKACPAHALMLQDSCGTCGKPLRSCYEVTLVPVTCECGAEVIPNLKREVANEAWIALAKFSDEVLAASPADLDILHLVPYVFSCATNETGLSGSAGLTRILARCFGVDGLEWLCRRRQSTQAITNAPIKNKQWTRKFEPHLAAAVLVACGISFDEAKHEVAYQKSLQSPEKLVVTRSRASDNEPRPTSISEAKKIAEEFARHRQQRSGLRAVKPYAYWMLYFQDWTWLWNWAHEREMQSWRKWKQPPSIEEDRIMICGTSSSAKRHMARARAYARDRSWLEHYKETRRPKIDRISKILPALVAARTQHFAEVGRPTKWTITLAAKRLRIPIGTLRGLARRNKPIAALVPESSQDFCGRLIDWGIETCIRQGFNLTPSKVQRTAILSGKTSVNLIASVIEKRKLK